MFTPVIDVVIHITNAIILVYSFLKLNYVPVTFILGGSGVWGVLVLIRVCIRAKGNVKSTSKSKSRDTPMAMNMMGTPTRDRESITMSPNTTASPGDAYLIVPNYT